METKVRLAIVEDSGAIARSSEQLGYPSTQEQAAQRLAQLIRFPEHAVFMAELDGVVVGWIHVSVSHSMLADPRAEVGGLIVDENVRGRGIGRALMQDAEHWARKKGCRSMRLRSNVVRSDAHMFYEKLGFLATKTQISFSKEIAAT